MFYPKEELVESCDPQAELIRYYGNHTLAFFGLAPENLHFLAPGDEGLVSYRLANNVAVVLGDPVCTPEAFERVTRSFLYFCALHNWRVAFYQANPEHLPTYRALKLRTFKIGEEAIIHPQTFTLNGSAMANVRISARRAERDEVVIHWHEGVPPTEVIHQQEQISDAWLERKDGRHTSEMGFSVGRLDELTDIAERADTVANIHWAGSTGNVVAKGIATRSAGSAEALAAISRAQRLVAPRVVTEVATTSSGKACAFVTFIPVFGSLAADATATDSQSVIQGWGWTLDLMRRAPDAPPGVIELLLVRAIERFRLCGAQLVSLGMVAMLDTRREMTPSQRQLASFVTDRLHLLESRRTLFNFKQKFHPHWESRYIVTSTILALPKIALAVLRLRNYSGGGLVRILK
ncbi:MAG: hypothetical protein NVSMB27_19990 [Ktedonobacteraceae bacterium]